MPVMESRRTATLKNVSDTDCKRKWDGYGYYWAPGQEKDLPENLAKVFIGDWDLEDPELILKEEDRVLRILPEDKRTAENLQLELVKVFEMDDNHLPKPEDFKKKGPEPIFPQEIEAEFPGKPAPKRPKK